MFIPQAQPHAQSLFLFPIVFGINLFFFVENHHRPLWLTHSAQDINGVWNEREKERYQGGFCKPNTVVGIRFDFRKGLRQGFGRGGSKYTRTCANRKFVLQTENWFSVSFSVRPDPMAKRLGTFKKILAETLLLSSHKVTKSALARKNVFFALPCFARQCGAGLIINGAAAAELFYMRESRKRRVNGKGTEEKEDYLNADDSWRRLSSPLSFSRSPCASDEQKLFLQTSSRHRAREVIDRDGFAET